MVKRSSNARRRASSKAYYRRKKAYRQYEKLYDARSKMLNQRGYSMYDEKLTYTEYKTAAAEMRNTMKEDIKRGKRKSMGSVNRALVSEQAYELSEEQGYAIFDFLRENADNYGIEYSTKNINEILMQIRQGDWLREEVGLWDLIRDYREDLFAKGYNKKQVRNEIAITFFGSPA